MHKLQHFFLFFILSSSIFILSSSIGIQTSEKTPSNPPYSITPHGSNHTDETRSSQIASQSTILQSRSNSESSLTSSPEPEDLNKKNPFIVIAQILNIDPKNLSQQAFHMCHTKQDLIKGKILKDLFNQGLTTPVTVILQGEEEHQSPIGCKPGQVIIRPNFFNLSNTQQEIVIAQAANQLNNCFCELTAISENVSLNNETTKPEDFKNLNPMLQEYFHYLNNQAILNLINQAREYNNSSKIRELSKFLLPYRKQCNEEIHNQEKSNSPESTPARPNSPCDNKKRKRSNSPTEEQ